MTTLLKKSLLLFACGAILVGCGSSTKSDTRSQRELHPGTSVGKVHDWDETEFTTKSGVKCLLLDSTEVNDFSVSCDWQNAATAPTSTLPSYLQTP